MSVAVIRNKWFCVICLITFLVALNYNNAFKLKDITSSDKPDEDRLRKGYSDKGLPPFKKITKIVHVDDDGDEDVEFKFEKVRKADFTVPQRVPKKPPREDVKEQTDPVVVEDADESLGYVSFILQSLGFGKSEEVESSTSNGIIEWLKGFKSDAKSENTEKPKETVPGSSSSWTSYLNRWPINIFIPFTKPTKTKHNEIGTQPNEFSAEEKGDLPLSQADFESLLHKLPNFIMNPSQAKDMECKKQLHIFHRQLRGHKLWTLQMMDASAKIPSSILRGHTNQFGDFHLCTQIKTVVKINPEQPLRVKGKYCLAHIELLLRNEKLRVPLYMLQGRGLWNSHLNNPTHFIPRYTTVNWGVCVPHMCPPSDVQQMIESALQPYNNTGVSFQVQVAEDDCYVHSRLRIATLLMNNWKVALTVGIYAFFILLVFTSTLFDNWKKVKTYALEYLQSITKLNNSSQEKNNEIEETGNEQNKSSKDAIKIVDSEKSTFWKILNCFSLKTTSEHLLSTVTEDYIIVLPVLRVISSAALYMSLKFLLVGHLPLTNRDKLVRILGNSLTIIIRSPLIYLDILLFISGLLSSRQMNQEIQKMSKIHVLKRIMARYLRYLPTLYVLLLFQTWILPNLGSGPLWGALLGFNARICERNMWRNLYVMQNILEFEETCSPMTVQVAVEIQLLLLTPLLVWLYYTNADVGFIVHGIIQFTSVALRFARTKSDSLSSTIFHGMNVSKFYRTASILYSSPIQRATPYLVGVGMGILLQRNVEKPQFSRTSKIVGWIMSLWCIFWCFWYPSQSTDTQFVYDSVDAAVYAAWTPLLISLSLSWIIFMTTIEDVPILIKNFLLSKSILVLSRISFTIQLVTYVVVLFSTASRKEVSKFELSDIVDVKEIFVILVLALVLAVLVDIPIKNIQKLLFTPSIRDEVQNDETEDMIQNKNIVAYNQDECENKKTEENEVEDIWGSESDQDEKKYTNNDIAEKHEKPSKRFSFNWNSTELEHENTHTESDINQEESSETESKPAIDSPESDEEEIEEEDEEDVAEEDEIVKRPETPEPLYRRKRWNTENN